MLAPMGEIVEKNRGLVADGRTSISATSNDLGRKTHHHAMKMGIITAVCHSSPIWTNLPFHDFTNYFNHNSWFTISGKS
jgi:hypothetical protein